MATPAASSATASQRRPEPASAPISDAVSTGLCGEPPASAPALPEDRLSAGAGPTPSHGTMMCAASVAIPRTLATPVIGACARAARAARRPPRGRRPRAVLRPSATDRWPTIETQAAGAPRAGIRESGATGGLAATTTSSGPAPSVTIATPSRACGVDSDEAAELERDRRDRAVRWRARAGRRRSRRSRRGARRPTAARRRRAPARRRSPAWLRRAGPRATRRRSRRASPPSPIAGPARRSAHRLRRRRPRVEASDGSVTAARTRTSSGSRGHTR